MKVLVVDDNKSNRMFLVKLLTSNNYEAEEAGNGVEALARIKASKPRLIISDVMMPKMDGFTLLRKIKKGKNTKDIPLVFYTAYFVSDKDRELAMKLGASRYIISPAEPIDLIEKIAAVLTEYEAGGIKPIEPLIKTEEEYLKRYSERIVRKLEEKIRELEDANEKLRHEMEERRQAEEKLQESKAKLKDAQRVAHIGSWDVDMVADKFHWSDEMYRIFGASPEISLTLESFIELIHPEDRHAMKRWIEETLAGLKPKELESRVVLPDGSVRFISGQDEAVFDSAGKPVCVFGTAQDITERKRAEEALRASEERYRILYENTPTMNFTVDTSGNVLSLNHFAVEELGYQPDELVGRPVLDIFYDEDKPALLKQFEFILKNPDIVSEWELRKVHKDGHIVWVREIARTTKDETGNTVILVACQDITKRKGIEKERDRLFNLSIDMLCIAGFDGYFKQLNPAWEKTLGWTNEELMSKPFLEFVHPDDREPTINATRGLSEGRVIITFDNRYLCRDGSYKWISWNSYPLVEEKLIFAVARDITERRLTEEMRIENVRLVSASKAKSDFLANMSHELRTPLNAVMGFSQLLKMKTTGELNEKQKTFVEDIIVSGNHLLSLINDILDLSKVEAGKIELVIEKMSVPDAINEGLTLVKEKAMRHRIALKVELDPRLEYIEADRLRFKQILFNLLSNAVKFSKPEGGVVTITAKKEEDTAKFSVSDTGIGIREEHIGKLFREFEQLDTGISRKYGGTGLGLAITKKLVELHGGKITAESTFGEGSTFTFILPVEKEEIK